MSVEAGQQEHAQLDPLLNLVMWGVNYSIQQLNHISGPAVLMPADFTAYSKTQIHSHLIKRVDIPSEFKFKDYCPLVFQNLRRKFGIADEGYVKSLTDKCLTNIDSPGRSGSLFLMSHDKHFIVKTLPYEEFAQLFHMLQDYYQYVVQRRMESLLPQFLSLYRITISASETYLVVMRSVFHPSYAIHRKYDLKGSKVDREASEIERAKVLPTFKDNDFISDNAALYVPDEHRTQLMDMLKADTQFLASLGLMDYSLLVGIHCTDQRVPVSSNVRVSWADEVMSNSLPLPQLLDKSMGVFAVASSDRSPSHEIYFLALIDILTHFGIKKLTAQAAKTIKHGIGAEISTIKPDQYAKRFLHFMEQVIR
jgi:1-phosphatidylinositol-5-phosphate 4-kinase